MPAIRIVSPVFRQIAGVPELYKLSQQHAQPSIHAFLYQLSRYRREAQTAHPKYRREAEAFPVFKGARGHSNNVAQLEAQSPKTRVGAGNWREGAKMIEHNRSHSDRVFGGIELHQWNAHSSKVKLDADLARSMTIGDVLEIREPELLSKDEEGQSTASSDEGLSENSVKQDLRIEELVRKALCMDGRSTPTWVTAGLNDCATRDGSQDAAQGNGRRNIHRAGTTSESIALLKSRVQRGITIDSYAFVKVLQMCLKQKDLEAVKQVHDCIIESGMDTNKYVVNTLLSLYIKCGELLDARRVFDQLGKKNILNWNMMIAGYAKSNHAKSALDLFKKMRQEGAQPDEVTYLCILKACAGPLALKWGKEVHECIRHTGFESDVRVGSALIHMYAEGGSIDDARIVFDRLQKRNVVTWNIMIGGLAQHGRGHDAYRLFLRMKQEGLEPNAITYLNILNASASTGVWEWVKAVHGQARIAGLELDVRVGSALVHMYAKGGSIDDARLVFDRMQKRNVVTWNIMIAGLAQHGHGHEAYRLFLRMKQEGVEPNSVTYLSILSASASPVALEWVKAVHGQACKAGLESDVRVASALVHMYAKGGSIDDARQVFLRMQIRDVVTWNIMIGGLAQHGLGHEAYQLFLQMKREGFEPNAFTYASILNASASEGALEWVNEVHSHAITAGLESDLRVGNALVHIYAKSGSIDDARLVFDRMQKRDVVTWTIMIGGLAQHGRGQEAYRLFLRMKQEGVEPDATTYVSILNASASAGGALEWVKDVHGQAREAGLESDVRVGSALMHMYAESGSIDNARLVFDRLQKRDVVTWNIMIAGLAQHGRGNEALELFKNMTVEGVKPDGVSFVAVLSACCHGGLVKEGRKLFSDMMPNYSIEPEIVHYNCMVDLLGRAGRLEEANLFISAMPVQPNAVTWRALLGACRTHGNLELGKLSAKEVFKLEPNDAAGYVLLSNIYAAAGMWENVSSVRSMMQKRGVRKEPGRSWIAVDNKVHEFVVGDMSHPEAKEIKSYLKELTEKLKAEGYIPDTRLVLHDIDEENKEVALCSHSEKLAIAYGLIHIPGEEPIRVTKNLRVCPDCHTATKLISKVTRREIIARDANRFHHFKDGVCSCGDYW